MKKYFDLLLTTPLFKGIDSADIGSLLRCLSASLKSYLANEPIFSVGDEINHVGIVCQGTVQIIQEDFLGNRTILANANAGELFGEAFACANTEHIPVNVLSKTKSEVIMIDYHKVITTCPSSCLFHNKLIENMLAILANKNIILNRKIEVLSKRSTREKIVTYLSFRASEERQNYFTIPFDRQELADFLCVDRSAMSTELGKMRKEGLLNVDRNAFEILWH